jgi:tetratricopeptide (TPR) repeat protein
MLGLVFNSSGNPAKAVPAIEYAMRLSPYNTSWLPYQLAKAYRHTERHEQAIQAYQELICHSPDSAVAYRDLAISYGTLGEKEKAKAAVSELLRIQPGYSLRDYISEGDSGVDPVVRDRNIDILRSAGLPE